MPSAKVLNTLWQLLHFRKLVCYCSLPFNIDPRLVKALIEVQLFFIDSSVSFEFKTLTGLKTHRGGNICFKYLQGTLWRDDDRTIKDKMFGELKKIPLQELKGSYSARIEGAFKRIFREQTWARFQHTIRVLKFAYNLALLVKLSEKEREQLVFACIYHDLAKTWRRQKLLSSASKLYSETKVELQKNLWWLHGPVAREYLERLAKKRKTVRLTQAALEAIEHHSRPIPTKNILLKVLIIADKLEPNKKKNFTAERYSELIKSLEEGRNENLEKVYNYFLSKPTKQLYT